jgi:hypothetical protein
MLLVLQLNNLLGDPPVLVTVPDVVGDTQIDGTAELEALLFVVAVETAHSSTVPAGTIISQSPAAGIDAVEGSTVTITVSLGEAPVVQQESGGGFYFGFDRIRYEREKRKREQEELEAETQAIQDSTDREIAKLLREQEARDAERAELTRLQTLADRFAGQAMKAGVSRKVSAAILKANEERTVSSLQAMQRQIEQMLEEEMISINISLLLDD